MTRWCLALVTCLVLGQAAIAGENQQEIEAEIERAIEEARHQVDQAAQHLGELHKKHYAMGAGKKKAMLGILLGEGSMRGGIELDGVTPGGGAEEAGMQAGDIIVELNDLSLAEDDNPMRALQQYMKGVEPGDEVRVVYKRGDVQETVDLTTQARSAFMLKMLSEKMEDIDIDIDIDELIDDMNVHKVWVHNDKSSRQLLAVSGDLAAYFDVKEGVIILEPPADSELKAGDVLLSVAGHNIEGLESAVEALDDIDERAEVTVKRRGKRKNINVTADEFAAATNGTRVIRIERPGEVVVKVETDD